MSLRSMSMSSLALLFLAGLAGCPAERPAEDGGVSDSGPLSDAGDAGRDAGNDEDGGVDDAGSDEDGGVADARCPGVRTCVLGRIDAEAQTITASALLADYEACAPADGNDALFEAVFDSLISGATKGESSVLNLDRTRSCAE